MTPYLLIALGALAYVTMGSWTFGYMAGKWAKENDHRHDYYYDEPGPWFAGIFWPIVLLFSLVFMRLVKFGTKQGVKTIENQRVRIELERKIRVEQEKIQHEIEAELEEELRKTRAA
jgi:hypothetical protein